MSISFMEALSVWMPRGTFNYRRILKIERLADELGVEVGYPLNSHSTFSLATRYGTFESSSLRWTETYLRRMKRGWVPRIKDA